MSTVGYLKAPVDFVEFIMKCHGDRPKLEIMRPIWIREEQHWENIKKGDEGVLLHISKLSAIKAIWLSSWSLQSILSVYYIIFLNCFSFGNPLSILCVSAAKSVLEIWVEKDPWRWFRLSPLVKTRKCGEGLGCCRGSVVGGACDATVGAPGGSQVRNGTALNWKWSNSGSRDGIQAPGLLTKLENSTFDIAQCWNV